MVRSVYLGAETKKLLLVLIIILLLSQNLLGCTDESSSKLFDSSKSSLKAEKQTYYYGWEAQYRDLNSDRSFIAIDFIDDNRGWAVIFQDGIVYRTTNGGSDWTIAGDPVGVYTLDMCFVPPSLYPLQLRGWAVRMLNGNIFRTIDGGATWAPVAVPGIIATDWYGIYFVDEDNGWAVGPDGAIARTIDGGATWEGQIVLDAGALWDVHFVDANVGWAVGSSCVLNTSDGGITWEIQNTTLSDLTEVYFITQQVGWTVSDDGSVWNTSDGGITWTKQTVAPNSLYSICFVSQTTGWAGGANLILNTTDGGKTWSVFEPEMPDGGTIGWLYGIDFTGSNIGWTAGGNETILHYDLIENTATPFPENLRVEGYSEGSLESLNITTRYPTFSWKFNDPEIEAQKAYNISVWKGPVDSELIWYKNVSGNNNTVKYNETGSGIKALPLKYGQYYNFSIQTQEFLGGRWSARAVMMFRLVDSWGSGWRPIEPANSPSPRYAHRMSFDSQRNKVVLFGGLLPGGRSSETWEYNNNWKLIARATTTKYATLSGAPAGYYNHENVRGKPDRDYCSHDPGLETTDGVWGSGYGTSDGKIDNVTITVVYTCDATSTSDKYILKYSLDDGNTFGETSCSFYPVHEDWGLGPIPQIVTLDITQDRTWTWEDISNLRVYCGYIRVEEPDTWTGYIDALYVTILTNSPSARSGHAMSFDSQRNKIVLFGGDDGSLCDDTWEYDGSNWTKITTANSPSARAYHAMVFDSSRNKIVLFGGTTGDNETWEYNGTDWERIVTAHTPPGRCCHALAFDSRRNKVVLFGGYGEIDGVYYYYNDTWEYDGNDWINITPMLSEAPIARDTHAMVFDSSRNKIVLFGGVFKNSTLISDDDLLLNDTWEYNGTSWVEIKTVPTPSARKDHAMVYDSKTNKLILFGGYDGNHRSDTWRYTEIFSIEYKFNKGWNFISLALYNESYQTAEALAKAIPYCNSIKKCNVSSQVFDTYTQETNFELETSAGYLIYLDRSTSWKLTGAKISPIKKLLKPGWNAIGILNLTLTRAENLSIKNSTALASWNNTLGRFVVYPSSLKISNFRIVAGEGYLVYLSAEETWINKQ